MLTAIVIDDLGSLAASLDKVQQLGDIAVVGETIVVSTDPAPTEFSAAGWIQRDSLVDALLEAVHVAASKRLILIGASVSVDLADLSRFSAEVEVSPSVEHLIVPIETGNGDICLPLITTDTVVQALQREELWPALFIATSRATLKEQVGTDADTVCELVVRAFISAIANGDTVRKSTTSSATIGRALVRSLCELEPAAKARCLAAAVDAINIEELFPEHAWSDFSQESAAAAYHSLAALFLRFGDTEAATQSLACSERLEESPRFFALKGLIQQKKGETLGAVANLVSSLQCYETRKSNDGKHYLAFKPKNLEIINSRLVDGLNALNRRENDKAITHFSEAVFNFDSFYAEHGVRVGTKGR